MKIIKTKDITVFKTFMRYSGTHTVDVPSIEGIYYLIPLRKNIKWCSHLGVVLGTDEKALTVRSSVFGSIIMP